MPAEIALVTTLDLPTIDADEEALLPLLPEAEVVPWEADVDWSAYRAVVLRSTWNYTEHLDAFLAWAKQVAAVTQLHNGLETIRWNIDKRYLGQLADVGVPTVPTSYVEPGEGLRDEDLQGSLVV